MITLFCKILVMVCIQSKNEECVGGFQTEDYLSGTYISENIENYLIDFSKEAKEKNYMGTYSAMSVNKNNCFKTRLK